MLKSVLKEANGYNSTIRLLGSSKTVEELKEMEITMLKKSGTSFATVPRNDVASGRRKHGDTFLRRTSCIWP